MRKFVIERQYLVPMYYLAHTIEEWRYYFDAIQSPAFNLSFTVNHAHLVPEGIAGFIEAIDMGRVEEVRLADCFRNGHEVHLKPGAGDIDFADMFRRIEGKGFTGHYTNAFGSLDEEGIGLLRNQGERVAVRRSKDLARRRATQRERSLAILTQGAASRCVRGTTSR
jgi:sugar phosphate isomerase/epimerase